MTMRAASTGSSDPFDVTNPWYEATGSITSTANVPMERNHEPSDGSFQPREQPRTTPALNSSSPFEPRSLGSGGHPPSSSSHTLPIRSLVDEAIGPEVSVLENKWRCRQIQWTNPRGEPRQSYILTQDRNGPCPLLAVANALSMQLPPYSDGYDKFLRGKSEVKLEDPEFKDAVLNLVLDASPKEAVEIDLETFGQFITQLADGLIVNPRFVPSDEEIENYMSRLQHLPESERRHAIPGTFAPTDDFQKYRKLGVPIVHGFIPHPNTSEHAAFQRRAHSFEEAQELRFEKEGLEERLHNEENPLMEEEFDKYIDITNMEQFGMAYGTQITEYGLEAVKRSMEPGSFSILYRNEHFSTIYRHPDGELFVLVMDEGMASHGVVWELLVDISQNNAQLFTGDFRPVGLSLTNEESNNSYSVPLTAPSTIQQQHYGLGSGSGHDNSIVPPRTSSANHLGIMSFPSQQEEDGDYAYALSLQEQFNKQAAEERRQNEAATAVHHRHTSQLSLNQQQQSSSASNRTAISTNNRPLTTANVFGAATTRPRPTGRRLPGATGSNTNSAGTEQQEGGGGGGDLPPPSYEDAAKQPSFLPPLGHPAHPTSSPTATENNASPVIVGAGAPVQQVEGRRVSGTARPTAPGFPRTIGQASGKKDCTVM